MQTRRTALFAVSLAFWLGLESIQTSLAMIVWNIGEDRPAAQLGVIALSIWLIGLLGAPLAGRLSGRRPEVPLAGLFGLAVAANAFSSHPLISAVLGTAMLVTWLWLLPALVTAVGRARAANMLTPAVLTGVAAFVAFHHALHGMDLAMLRGPLAGTLSVILAAALIVTTRALPGYSTEPVVAPGWGLLVLGPYLVLQLTLLANSGRVQMLGEMDAQQAAAVILLGLIAGGGLLTLALPRPTYGAAAIAAVLVLRYPRWLAGEGIWLIAVLQALLAPLVAAALVPAQSRPARIYRGTAGAALLMFPLLFLFYSRYGWAALWQIMGLLVVLPAAAARFPAPLRRGTPQRMLVAILIAGLGIGVHAATERRAPTVPGPTPVELTVLTYNIHMGFNAHSVPDPGAVASVIERSDADLVALQEVGRGWTVNGGADLASWLRWRLPQYHFVYGPMNGDLWGNVILSRYPLAGSGASRYPVRESAFQRGLAWASIPTPAGEVLFVNTHFSAYAPYEQDRLAQAGDLLAFVNGRPRTILAGDFNAAPASPVMQHLWAAGLVDLTAPHGIGAAPTYSALAPRDRIDYLLSTPDIESLAAAIVTTTASDHLPVLATIRLR